MKISPTENKSLLRLHALPGVGAMRARKILQEFGTATDFFQSSKDYASSFLPSLEQRPLGRMNPKTGLGDPVDYWSPTYKDLAQREYEFIENQKIQMYYYQSDSYPFYLKQAADAPILLFGKGQLDLEHKKIVAIVGTRKISAYGTQFCKNLMEELAPLDPVIVSGFALGVDICAQRAAVEVGLQTIGCLAHGFKHLYPKAHRGDIKPVMQKGGFFTEFFSGVPALQGHFVSRNRVIAGLSQATIVIESAKQGGSLHTAQLANSYNRSVFAVPGRSTDRVSEGCNDLIKHLKAQMLTSARDLILSMNWGNHPNLSLHLGGPIGHEGLQGAVQQTSNAPRIEATQSPEEKQLYEFLFTRGEMHVDAIARALSWKINQLLPSLMTMELKGMVRALPGKKYEAI